MTNPVEERFWSKVYFPPCKDDCWLWTAGINTGNNRGYGQFSVNNVSRPAHRIAYEMSFGLTIPNGFVLDHICRNRRCVNPSHLEVVTHKENILRGEGITARYATALLCKHGHPLSGENLRMRRDGKRACRACGN